MSSSRGRRFPNISTTFYGILFSCEDSQPCRTPKRQGPDRERDSRVTAQDRRRECGLWVFNLRPSLNLWIARINLFWLRLRRAGSIGAICGPLVSGAKAHSGKNASGLGKNFLINSVLECSCC